MNMDLQIITAVVFGVIASFLGSFWAFHGAGKVEGETTEERVKKLTRSLHEALSLIKSIEGEIKARSTLASQLQNDIDTYNKLVDVKKPEVEAIAQLLRGELKKEGRSSFWKGVLTNFLFFILGAAASWFIK